MTLGVFLALLLIGAPIGLVLCWAALAYVAATGNWVLLDTYTLKLFTSLDNYGLLAIPLFILIGEIMNGAGITTALVRLAAAFVGALRGGLAYVNLLANMMVASILGSATAQIAMMSQIMVPEMDRAGYDRAYAAGVTAYGGMLGPIIPPSIVFVVYAVLAQVAVRDMLLAGVVPGLILSGLFLLVIAGLGWVYAYPAGERLSWRDRALALVRALPMLAIPAVIVGVIVGGVGSPIEAAAVGVLVAALVGFVVTRSLRLGDLPGILVRTGLNSALVLFLVSAAGVFSWVLIFGQVPQTVAAWATSVADTPAAFMLLVLLLLLLLGTVIDGIPGLIMAVPILLPIATQTYGVHPVHFGVVASVTLILGLLSPPVGIGLFVASAVTGVGALRLFWVSLPFFLVSCVALAALALFPGLSLVFL